VSGGSTRRTRGATASSCSRSDEKMELSGALYEPSLLPKLRRLNGLRKRLLADATSEIGSDPLPRRNDWMLQAVTRVLINAQQPMRVRDVHQAVERLLRMTVPRTSVKDCLSRSSRGNNPKFERVKRGWYGVRGMNKSA